ncbi:MAG: twin-arginine translocase TatA/TatE family subunit [Verrucomicrobiae bacterium]|nr:twin-arginine translocase TatA/TatE family subunit [Verrucomicrobiae bacterium]
MHSCLALGMPSGGEWVVLLIIVVLLFGAKRIPELFRGFGSGVREFKKGLHEEDPPRRDPPSDDKLSDDKSDRV